MTNDDRKMRLGRGLAALIGDGVDLSDTVTRNNLTLPMTDIAPNPLNPRTSFDNDHLNELAQSVRERGIIQPILVRPAPPESSAIYEIVAGERRWRAAQIAGLTEVPAIVANINNQQMLEIAIIENIQREDLSPIEEARSYDTLLKRNHHSQDDVARIVGKSRSHIANLVRLLNLPESIQIRVDRGELSVGQARPLIGHPDAEELANDIIRGKLNARDAENLAKKHKAPTAASQGVKSPEQIDANAAAQDISEKLGLSVRINHGKKGKGRLIIDYLDLSQLEDILARLGRDSDHGKR